MINDDLIWEVLVRLPTKSLMRFKCVSKLWYSVIRNPKFAIAHDGNSVGEGCFRGLLITDFGFDTSGRAQRFFRVNFNDCPRLMHHHMTIEESDFTCVTRVVKGLIGLYKNDINEFTLCNIATHELLNLPPSPSPVASTESDSDFHKYFLGFDLVNEVFKVLSICICVEEEDNIKGDLNIHVFTLGVNNSDMKWRNIAPPPLDVYFLARQYLCINGALYWLPYEGEYNQTLIAFHLNNETFEIIAIPECTQGRFDLVETCGSPSLLVVDQTSDYVEMLDVWTIKNHYKGVGLEAWTRKRVSFPTSLSEAGMLNYVGMLPTGEMILVDRESDNFPLPIYIYDHLKNKLNSTRIEGYGSQESGMDPQELKICYYEENIISLDCLMSNQLQDQMRAKPRKGRGRPRGSRNKRK